jgi:transposase InsO family protein
MCTRCPSVSDRRGFVSPQPHKRPRSSWIRFEAQLPNECWQSDVTHWRLHDGTDVEVVNFLDDQSRLAVASRVLCHGHGAGGARGLPRSRRTLGLAGGAAHGQRMRLDHLARGVGPT